ncbi:MAG: hypothetical protein R3264_02995 [Anaerolineae bacterium]|nr:hypothetical protein [Anaerolineae bacterium]
MPSVKLGFSPWDAHTFAKQQGAEACRRGLERAKQIVSVNDGALWIWVIVQMCWAWPPAAQRPPCASL